MVCLCQKYHLLTSKFFLSFCCFGHIVLHRRIVLLLHDISMVISEFFITFEICKEF